MVFIRCWVVVLGPKLLHHWPQCFAPFFVFRSSSKATNLIIPPLLKAPLLSNTIVPSIEKLRCLDVVEQKRPAEVAVKS